MYAGRVWGLGRVCSRPTPGVQRTYAGRAADTRLVLRGATERWPFCVEGSRAGPMTAEAGSGMLGVRWAKWDGALAVEGMEWHCRAGYSSPTTVPGRAAA